MTRTSPAPAAIRSRIAWTTSAIRPTARGRAWSNSGGNHNTPRSLETTSMKVSKLIRGLGALGVLAAAASCHSLDVTNPNAPSSKILTDPGILKAVAGGTMRTWFNAYDALSIAGVLDVQALTLAS